MRNKIILAGIVIMVISCSVRNNAVNGPSFIYRRDTNLSKFVGTWEYKSDSVYFKIVFEQRVQVFPVGKADIVAGWHTFSKFGKVIESSMDSLYRSTQSETIGGNTHNDPNMLYLSYRDRGRDRTNYATLKLNPDNPNEAVWRLTLSEKMYINTRSPAWAKDLLPLNTDWIMHKVE